jgi:glycosyltransferase involved in cell wall biosynthesis
LLEHVYYGIAGILFKKLCRIKLFTHSHNIEFQRFKNQGVWWWRILYQVEKITYKHSDHIFFKTKEDQSKAIALFGISINKTTIVPYGIEKKILNKEQSKKYLQTTYSLPADYKIILFASTLDYLPNANAVEFIYGDIARALSGTNSTILICGRNKIKGFEYLRELKATNVINCGEVNNIDDYFNGADVFIDPVEIAAGIQTKILDALSFNLNVVCYPQLLNGIDIEITGKKLFIARESNSTDFINKIKLALNHQSDIPSSFYDKYEWSHIVKKTATSIRQIIH